MKNHLIIFSRFPVPGKTKTRMIPRLGEDGAARLQELMMGRTVLRARTWVAGTSTQLHVQYTGALRRSFRRWLGPDLIYDRQGSGNLGKRMNAAVAGAFASGASRVVLIGCDCPDMTSHHLNQAFIALNDHDVVVGPARDGGYYSIGFRKHLPHFFEGIAWGASDVFERTSDIASQFDHRMAVLENLDDVDNPGDLSVWERAQPDHPFNTISVIIPALNEEASIFHAIKSALTGAHEVIVADGGSRDRTLEIARQAGAKVCCAPRGRAYQMNAGAMMARGDVLLFLHADARLPEGYAAHVRNVMTRRHALLGAFSLKVHADGRGYRMVERGVASRCRWWSMPYGDQALFVKHETFLRLGGYMNRLLMEDVDLVRRAKRRGRVVVADKHVTVSARRWRKMGILKTTLWNQLFLAGYGVGVSTDRLARWYYSRPESGASPSIEKSNRGKWLVSSHAFTPPSLREKE